MTARPEVLSATHNVMLEIVARDSVEPAIVQRTMTGPTLDARCWDGTESRFVILTHLSVDDLCQRVESALSAAGIEASIAAWPVSVSTSRGPK